MWSNPPLVSILISNYNYGRFLRQAIDSALAQTWPRTEIVVVDDGSTGDSRELIRSYGRSVIPVLQENGGQASAFNAGFIASQGDILCFLDSDDVFLPRKLERLVEAWRRNPDTGLIYHRMLFIDGHGRNSGSRWPTSVLNGWLKSRVARAGGWWPLPTTSELACSRAYLERVLPVPCGPFRYCADAYVGGLAPLLTPTLGLREPLAKYRVHGANGLRSTSDSEENLRRQISRYEIEFDQLQIALTRFAPGLSAVSPEDHYPYQWCRWKAGGPVTKWKVLTTALRTPSLPFAMKCKEMLKTVVGSTARSTDTVMW